MIHDPPEIIAAQETFLIIITIGKPAALLHMFIETVMHYQKFNVRFSKKEGKIIILFFLARTHDVTKAFLFSKLMYFELFIHKIILTKND